MAPAEGRRSSKPARGPRDPQRPPARGGLGDARDLDGTEERPGVSEAPERGRRQIRRTRHGPEGGGDGLFETGRDAKRGCSPSRARRSMPARQVLRNVSSAVPAMSGRSLMPSSSSSIVTGRHGWARPAGPPRRRDGTGRRRGRRRAALWTPWPRLRAAERCRSCATSRPWAMIARRRAAHSFSEPRVRAGIAVRGTRRHARPAWRRRPRTRRDGARGRAGVLPGAGRNRSRSGDAAVSMSPRVPRGRGGGGSSERVAAAGADRRWWPRLRPMVGRPDAPSASVFACSV